MSDIKSSGNGPSGQTKAEDSKSEKKTFEILVDDEHDHPELSPLDEEGSLGLDDVLKRLDEAEDAVRKHQDDVLRVQAEMQNLRRRTEQDIEKAHKFGQERFVTELLGVIDNLERALESAMLDEAEEAQGSSGYDKVKAIREGVDLTLKSLVDCFTKFSIEVVDPLGEPFDPLLHQAISTQENPNAEPNSVTMVMQKGYLLHGRVIRPAMVIVSK
ncbi:MAG: nucleotide exchange factor GrpE [Gammaproteobacteria bacterium]|nr:nucleotide exchange factor GrpE [Gammaproteobacteria bacterium]